MLPDETVKNAECLSSAPHFDLEVKLRPDEDPVSANRAYRDIRNLRTHFATPLVTLDQRVQLSDVAADRAHNPAPECYILPLDWPTVSTLKTPQLCEVDIWRFNKWASHKNLGEVTGQMLLLMRSIIRDVGDVISNSH